MIHGINFGHNRKWAAHSDMGLMEEARNVLLPALMRISAFAKARVNRNGHAEFGPAEIANVLMLLDKKTGETRPMAKNQVANLIKQGKDAGLFGEESSARCIVLSGLVVQRNTGTGSCKHHNINKSGNEMFEEVEAVAETKPAVKPKEATGNWDEPESDEVVEEDLDMTREEFGAWIETVSETEQDVAYYGMQHRENDPLTKVVLVAQEAVKKEYNWCPSIQVRYSYAANNVSYEGPATTRNKKEPVSAGPKNSMEEPW